MNNAAIEHLLVMTQGFPADEEDTSCLTALQQLLICYRELFPRTQISIISLHYPHTAANYKWKGMDVYALGGQSARGMSRLGIILTAIRTGLRINRRKKINAVFCIAIADGGLAGKILSRLCRIPYLIWIYGQDAKKGNKFFSYINPAPENLAAMSDYQNEVLHEAYDKAAKHIIYNGVNTSVFPSFNAWPRPVDLLAVGALIPLKQYHLFVELIAFLKENGCPEIKAVLVGDGPLIGELKDLVKLHQLENNLEVKGATEHKEVLELMNRAKLFVHTSNYEGHSTVMLEALYSGCKVVSFISAGRVVVKNFNLCAGFDTMKIVSADILKANLIFERTNYYDMQTSAQKLNTVLTDLL